MDSLFIQQVIIQSLYNLEIDVRRVTVYYKHHFKVSHQKCAKISNGNGKRISDVANDWGFCHMGVVCRGLQKIF
jgi:hypothetical protein